MIYALRANILSTVLQKYQKTNFYYLYIYIYHIEMFIWLSKVLKLLDQLK